MPLGKSSRGTLGIRQDCGVIPVYKPALRTVRHFSPDTVTSGGFFFLSCLDAFEFHEDVLILRVRGEICGAVFAGRGEAEFAACFAEFVNAPIGFSLVLSGGWLDIDGFDALAGIDAGRPPGDFVPLGT